MCWYHFSFFFDPPLISKTIALSWTRTSVMTTLSPGLAAIPFSATNCATCASLGVTTPCLISRPLCPMGNVRRAKTYSAVRSRISSIRVCGVSFSGAGLAGLVSSANMGSASSRAAVTNNERRGRFMGIPGLIALYPHVSCQLECLSSSLNEKVENRQLATSCYRPARRPADHRRPDHGQQRLTGDRQLFFVTGIFHTITSPTSTAIVPVALASIPYLPPVIHFGPVVEVRTTTLNIRNPLTGRPNRNPSAVFQPK